MTPTEKYPYAALNFGYHGNDLPPSFNQEAGWYLGLDDEVIYRIDRQTLEAQALLKLDPDPAPKYMSVDEVAWQKWHKYFTNAVDIEYRKVIWNHNHRGKEILSNFYRALRTPACQKIKGVASDGAQGYLSATREPAPEALIVLDHFHVKSYLNEAVYQAMLLKMQFLSIYQARNWKTARVNLRDWIKAAIRSTLPPFVKLEYKFFRKRHYVLNYFRLKITTAISERVNSKIKRSNPDGLRLPGR